MSLVRRRKGLCVSYALADSTDLYKFKGGLEQKSLRITALGHSPLCHFDFKNLLDQRCKFSPIKTSVHGGKILWISH